MTDKFKQKLKQKGVLLLYVKVSAGAKKNGFREVMDDGTLKVDIKARAEKGKANDELVKFLAKELEVDASCVKILKGKSNVKKLVKVEAR